MLRISLSTVCLYSLLTYPINAPHLTCFHICLQRTVHHPVPNCSIRPPHLTINYVVHKQSSTPLSENSSSNCEPERERFCYSSLPPPIKIPLFVPKVLAKVHLFFLSPSFHAIADQWHTSVIVPSYSTIIHKNLDIVLARLPFP